MKTYQDYIEYREKGQELDFIKAAISEYRASPENRIAPRRREIIPRRGQKSKRARA